MVTVVFLPWLQLSHCIGYNLVIAMVTVVLLPWLQLSRCHGYS